MRVCVCVCVCMFVCVLEVKKEREKEKERERERKKESTNKVAYLNSDFIGLPEWLEVAEVDEIFIFCSKFVEVGIARHQPIHQPR